MGTSQMVTKSWNAQPDGRPGGPRKPREAPEGPGGPRRAPESPGKPRKASEGPGKPRKASEGPGSPGKPRKPRRAPEGPGSPGKARKPRKPRKASEGPRRAPEDPGKARKAQESLGGPRKAPEAPGRPGSLGSLGSPGLQKTLPGNRRGPAGLSVRKEAGLRRAGAGIAGARPAEGRRPLSFRPRRKRAADRGAADRGGCGLAPVQGRLSASLKQVPGCLKGRCPATWVHERAEIAPNRAQRQRPAASGRSRGDCPQVQGQNTAAGRFFWSVNVTFCVFSTRTDCRRPFSGAGAGRASGGVVPTVPAAA